MTTTELLLERADPTAPDAVGYRLTPAADVGDVFVGQQLRFNLFSSECGAITSGPDGMEADPADDFCDHFIVQRSTRTRCGRLDMDAAAPRYLSFFLGAWA